MPSDTGEILHYAKIPVMGTRVIILGLTFKENIPDILHELVSHGVKVLVHDPLAYTAQALREHGIRLNTWEELTKLDGVVLAVPHEKYLKLLPSGTTWMLREKYIVVDINSVLEPYLGVNASVNWNL